jgi:hypothetical protein
MLKNHELFSTVPDRLIIQFLMRYPGALRLESAVEAPEKRLPHVSFINQEGSRWSIPAISFQDFIKDSPEFTERFFRYLHITNAN